METQVEADQLPPAKTPHSLGKQIEWKQEVSGLYPNGNTSSPHSLGKQIEWKY
ncbi:hypothetical protein [Microcoleus sp. Z1_B5]|uniref:hypothetical protein n=1 Tax=Microcoleus sp. Z1_B5 TaxID=3055430 RepID=UPI002FCF57D5